ncbi:DUF2480 family protein [Persicobacter diffluens]|uniref:DUF2480 family protein n=1 Tax=Persicobacter diffluens TaxID=981 RepID=A0AAN5AM94_9BACT|nr:hypothetical protein PEDI_27380 [Persicobacter diffluens]
MSLQDQPIVNKVANSGLEQIDLETLRPEGERVLLDIKDQLFQGMILREKDFRDFVKATDWTQYQDKHVAITCSEDAIVPTWAFMLLTTRLNPFAHTIVFGDLEELETVIFRKALAHFDYKQFEDKMVVIKGCSDKAVPTSAYVELSHRLVPHAKGIMYGEPCSTVPIYKKPRKK